MSSVLIVDDSLTMRKFLEKNLRMTALPIEEIAEAQHGAEAIELLRKKIYDIVFLDLNMPVLGGIEVARFLYSHGLLGRCRVVVVSSDASQAHAQELQKLGVTRFFRKPFRPETFAAMMQEHFGDKLA